MGKEQRKGDKRMITIEDYRKYVEKIMDKGLPDILNNEGRALLEEDFKQRTIEIFEDYINEDRYWYDVNLVKKIKEKEKNRVNFIYNISFYERLKIFINDNWERLDEIIEILENYINEKKISD
jgi:hypothetical protein